MNKVNSLELKIKNSLKNGPDELGYYGEGEKARGGFAVGETLMPNLKNFKKLLRVL